MSGFIHFPNGGYDATHLSNANAFMPHTPAALPATQGSPRPSPRSEKINNLGEHDGIRHDWRNGCDQRLSFEDMLHRIADEHKRLRAEVWNLRRLAMQGGIWHAGEPMMQEPVHSINAVLGHQHRPFAGYQQMMQTTQESTIPFQTEDVKDSALILSPRLWQEAPMVFDVELLPEKPPAGMPSPRDTFDCSPSWRFQNLGNFMNGMQNGKPDPDVCSALTKPVCGFDEDYDYHLEQKDNCDMFKDNDQKAAPNNCKGFTEDGNILDGKLNGRNDKEDSPTYVKSPKNRRRRSDDEWKASRSANSWRRFSRRSDGDDMKSSSGRSSRRTNDDRHDGTSSCSSQDSSGAPLRGSRLEVLIGDRITICRVSSLRTDDSGVPLSSPSRHLVATLVTNPLFDAVIGFVILVDGVLLGCEAETNMNAAPDSFLKRYSGLFQDISLAIKIIFTIELLLRFYGFGPINVLWRSIWVRFDAALVCMAWCDNLIALMGKKELLSKITVLRVFRLARLARAARLVVQFRTLWLLLSGLKASLMTMLWTWILIMAIGYIFAVFGMETIPPNPKEDFDNNNFNRVAVENFGCIINAMLTLLQVLTLDSIGDIYRPLIQAGNGGTESSRLFVASYFLLFIFIVSVALMNLVTAVMVEGSLKQANEDKEALRAFEEQRKKKMVPRLREMFSIIDEDGSGEVSLDEIEAAPERLKEDLRTITKTDDLRSIFELLDDDDSGSVQIDEFLEGILKASSGDVLLKLQIGRLVRQLGYVKNALEDLNVLIVALQKAGIVDQKDMKFFGAGNT